MSDQRKTSSDKLQEMLGFDAAKKGTLTNDLFGEVVKEIQQERHDEAKKRAKEHLVKAINLREQMEKARKDFEGQAKKFDKELGKVLNQIQGILTGKCPDEEKEENESAKEGEVVSA